MSDNDILNNALTMRIDKSEMEMFKEKAPRITGKSHATLLREIITAFNDDRLRIIPTQDQEALGELYNLKGK